MKTNRTKAFTLLEMIVVLGGIAALAAALLVPMIRHLDELARKKEADTLRTFADGFRRRIMVTKQVPDQTTWGSVVGAAVGIDANNVLSNDRGLSRIFLIDPNLAIGNNLNIALPYNQPTAGHTVVNVSGVLQKPNSPRFLLVSSVGAPLPSGLVSGYAGSAGAFNDIWVTIDGAKPSGWTWTGRGDDLKIQRVDLTDVFVPVFLSNRDTNLVPSYAIESLGSLSVAYGTGRAGYFLKGTEIKLYNAVGVLEYSEVLFNPASFTFEFGTWQGGSFLANSLGQISPLDLQKAMNWFMASPTNQYAKFGASQLGVSNAMVAFMTNYINWRDGNPSYNGQFQGQGNPPSSVDTAQKNLNTVSKNLLFHQ